MGISERRRRQLLLAQAGIAASGASVAIVSVLTALQARTGSWFPLCILLAAAVSALAWWGVLTLERTKFRVREAPNVDWAVELREVRDSRRVIVAAFEIERRRIERDLHDGTQQYLVAATMKLGEASLLLDQNTGECDTPGAIAQLLEHAHQNAEQALRSLRDTVSGIHPQVLSDLGLHAAVTELAERSSLDVTVRCPHTLPAMPTEVAAVAWFFCSEALTNIAKYAPESRVTLLLAADDELHASIMDNGPGGAHYRDSGGLLGMRERMAAFGGAMELTSPPGGPTSLSARIPLLLAPVHDKESTP